MLTTGAPSGLLVYRAAVAGLGVVLQVISEPETLQEPVLTIVTTGLQHISVTVAVPMDNALLADAPANASATSM